MHNFIHNKTTTPHIFYDLFQQNQDIHKHNTRNKLDFNLTHNAKYKQDPLALGTHLLNSLPHQLKLPQRNQTFKKLLKAHLLSLNT